MLPINDVAPILASIRDILSNANTALDSGEDPKWYLQVACLRLKILLEAAGLLECLKSLRQIEEEAKNNWAATEFDDESGENYLVWGARLYQYIGALEIILGEPKTSIIAKDIIEILRATQYSITDKNCFQNPPASEIDVHSRIEAVLRCIFPDLLHKPNITKQIKQFQPDTGLPSIGTLVEYKFMANHGEEKRIADEILADTRGYLSKEWKSYIYVVYETKRIKPESQWRQLLREAGLKTNTEILVISGEEPKRVRRSGRASMSAAKVKL